MFRLLAFKGAVAKFPPTFEGNPFTYAFALFALALLSAMSLSLLIHFALESRRHWRVHTLIDNRLPSPRPEKLPWSLIAFRGIICCLLLTLVFGALPDVLVLLAWGEATEGTMTMLFLIDRVFDGLTVVPFITAITLIAWSSQSHEQLLLAYGDVQLPAFNLRVLKQNLKLILLVLLIVVGVTVGKASV